MESGRFQGSTDFSSENDSYDTNIRRVENFKVLSSKYYEANHYDGPSDDK
jgi:hypothetical protein